MRNIKRDTTIEYKEKKLRKVVKGKNMRKNILLP